MTMLDILNSGANAQPGGSISLVVDSRFVYTELHVDAVELRERNWRVRSNNWSSISTDIELP